MAHPQPDTLTAPAPLPIATARLAHLGLLPFVLGAALVWLVNLDVQPFVAQGLSTYAALVVALLGGVHWGLGFRQLEPPLALFGWGFAALALAWAAVMMPAGSGLVLEGVLLVGCYLVDRKVYPAQGLARWLTLRFRLSAVAALCCFLGAAGISPHA
jgi:hypothetical protein